MKEVKISVLSLININYIILFKEDYNLHRDREQYFV